MTVNFYNIDKAVEQYLKEIIFNKGIAFLEINFNYIVRKINDKFQKNIVAENLYKSVFRDLTPSRNSINDIFSFCLNPEFKPMFDESEIIYRKWVINFFNSKIIIQQNNNYKVDLEYSKGVLQTYFSWINNYKEFRKSGLLQKAIMREMGELPFGKEIIYCPSNLLLQHEIVDQLKNNSPLQITVEKEVIILREKDDNIFLTRKNKYLFTSGDLCKWLENFGINISSVTASYIIDFGMPYSGKVIGISEILRFTSNGLGVIGILAFELNYLIELSSSKDLVFTAYYHPLHQSVVLALARLENYINPTL